MVYFLYFQKKIFWIYIYIYTFCKKSPSIGLYIIFFGGDNNDMGMGYHILFIDELIYIILIIQNVLTLELQKKQNFL